MRKKQWMVLAIFTLLSIELSAGVLKGSVKDKVSGETLIGANIIVDGTPKGGVSDLDGNFEIRDIKPGTYTINVQYMGYVNASFENTTISNNKETILHVALEPDVQKLKDVVIVGQMVRGSESVMSRMQQTSKLVQTGISAQQISKTQDKDATEVIKRVPGISLIDDKFVMVRGLSQRYNNVWINGSAVPSSEADSRAFSFDIIPSSQLENMQIIKSPAPEYPADFSGGFILINTKDVNSENQLNVSIGASVNDQTHFRNFIKAKGSKTDMLGFDNGFRTLRDGINTKLNTLSNGGIDLLNNGLNNDWTVSKKTPISDFSFNINGNHNFDFKSGGKLSVLASLNYSNSHKTFTDMENSLFGCYDETKGESAYLRKSTDDQYNVNTRVGAMLNITLLSPSGKHKYEFKNIFNQLGKERYTLREGVSAQNDTEESAEYYYNSRTTYNGQFAGKHTFTKGLLTWNAGYAFANRNLPDRRRYLINDALEYGVMGLSSSNDISRESTYLTENILSLGVDYNHDFEFGSFAPSLKTGLYMEHRDREYTTRSFIYNWNNADNNLPTGFRYMDIPTELLQDENYGADKLYMIEEVKWRNNYNGKNMMAAGYVGLSLPIGFLDIYAGVRYEYNKMELINNTRDYEKSPLSTFYTNKDIFPSINTTYRFNEKNQLRLSYGQSVNRAEFREVSPSVYYDFDLASNVQGNTDLKSCYIHNVDFRYELYPNKGESISVALFYKKFNSPIEWTYTVTGGTDLTYSYRNAKGATSYGVEVDIRKNLDFIGLNNFSFTFNGSLIKSDVTFAKDDLQKDRPMQGQSPYLVNTGIFYQSEKYGWSSSILYNRIGKRIIGVGRSVGTTGGDETSNIPNSYEMPRNSLDLNLGKKFGEHWEVKAAIRDLLAEKATCEQITDNGEHQITKQYRPGRNFNIHISYHF